MNQLVPCPSCARHVRQSEASCPFCSAELSLGNVPAPVLPRGRLGRAATLAFGASLVGATSLVACGGSSEEGKEEGKGGDGTVTPVYGAPAAGMAGQQAGGSSTAGTGGSSTAGTGGTSTGGAPIGGGAPAYGAPPAGMNAGGNAGSGGEGGSGGNAGTTANGGTGGPNVGPVYGTPPVPAE